jgi:hypothetical protein
MSDMTTLFTHIQLAYPSFRGPLQTALDAQPHNGAGRSLLIAMKDLCEFFIPTVRFTNNMYVSLHTDIPVHNNRLTDVFPTLYQY